MKDIIVFLRRPVSKRKRDLTVKSCIKVILLLLLIDIVLTVITFFPLFYLSEAFSIEKLPSLEVRNIDFLSSTSGYLTIILLISPVFEEITNRLFLVFRKRNIILSLLFNIGLISYIIVSKQEFYITGIAISCGIFVALSVVLSRNTVLSKLSKIWKGSYSYVFYFSVILFTVYHALEYDIQSITKLLIIFVIVLPKAFSGYLLGYARVRMGFAWGLLLHITMNVVYSYHFIYMAIAKLPV